jgi:hypothetical protein
MYSLMSATARILMSFVSDVKNTAIIHVCHGKNTDVIHIRRHSYLTSFISDVIHI